eukprot:COSAG05_NODE_3151_length_2284_cov_2.301144_3_plen_101_part_00
MRADIIGHARINMQVNFRHAWFKMADSFRTHRSQRRETVLKRRSRVFVGVCTMIADIDHSLRQLCGAGTAVRVVGGTDAARTDGCTELLDTCKISLAAHA